MTETTFNDDQEAFAWAETKFNEAKRADKPDRVFQGNWKLSERWFSFCKGRDKSAETELEEAMARTSTELGASMSSLGMSEQNPKKRSAADMHKSSLGKTQQLASKLARSLASCEASLPKVRRQVDAKVYQRLRDGLCACRLARDHALDHLEDLRVLPSQEHEQDMTIEELNKLSKELQEHNSALLEAFNIKKGDGTEIKRDKEASEAASSAGVYWGS